MRKIQFKHSIVSGGLLLAVCCAPIAMAAPGPAQGETSGPASGNQTTPGTAVQKQSSATSGAAGGAGVEGKQGGESGSKPHSSNTSGQPNSR